MQSELIQKPFRFYLKQNLRSFSLGIGALLVTNWLDALWPLFLKTAIDQISSHAPQSALKNTVGTFLIIILLTMTFRYLWRVLFGRFHHQVAMDLRNRIFQHYLKLGPSFFHKNPVGELMSLITSDVNTFRMAIGPGILVLMDSFLIMCATVPLMIYLNADWTWKCLLLLPIVPVMVKKVMILIIDGYKAQQDRFSELSGISQEIVSGIRIIKSFVQEKNQVNHYNKKSNEYELACNKVNKVDSYFEPIMHFGVASGCVILLYVSAEPIIQQTITIGTFVAFHRYIQKMIWPVTAIGIGISNIQKGKASFKRIANLLSTESDVKDYGQTELKKFETLEIKNLTFTYPGQTQAALKNINCKIVRGETIGIIGPVGAGKSTFVQLLCHLYPVPEKSILINQIPMEDFSTKSLRSTITLVTQEPFLFSETIAENIAGAMTNEFDSFKEVQKIQTMAQIVNISEEIESLPQKYDSQLGERGVNLSGGQKQRMTIARGLMRDSDVIILDDSLSAVDAKTDLQIQRALQNATTHQTRILISHRISTIQNADKIIVLKDGEIEAIGKHQELLKKSSTYQNLAAIQNESHQEIHV